MPKVKKLPKWAIRQAGGINKKAWALARRGKTSSQRTRKGPKVRKAPRRRSPRPVSGASHTNNSKPGWGKAFRTGRTVDVFSGPGQGALANHGLTKEAGMEALRRYSGGLSEGEFDADTAKNTAGGIGTGLVRDWFRSKLGIYRGLGRKKILSGVMAANPEILATTEVNPAGSIEALETWNNRRMMYDRSYSPRDHQWSPRPDRPQGERFWKSLAFDGAMKVTQKVAEKYINPMLPPGYNL